MSPDYEIAEGDTLPVIVAEFDDVNGDPVSLVEGDAVVLRVQRSGGRDEAIEVECEVTQLSPAIVQSAPLDGLAAGRYDARFVVSFNAGGQLSWPNTEPIYVRVHKTLTPAESS